MSVEILENEIVVRIPKSKYNSDVQKLIDAIETPSNESVFFEDVEAGSELESLLLEVKKDRAKIMKPILDKIKENL